MIQDDNRYWPFAVLAPEERTELHHKEIGFLETAYQEGYEPYFFGAGNFGATCGDRGGLIFVRGRARWEVRLGTVSETALSAYVDDFTEAARAVLLWLGGGEAAEIGDQIRAEQPATRSGRPVRSPSQVVLE